MIPEARPSNVIHWCAQYSRGGKNLLQHASGGSGMRTQALKNVHVEVERFGGELIIEDHTRCRQPITLSIIRLTALTIMAQHATWAAARLIG